MRLLIIFILISFFDIQVFAQSHFSQSVDSTHMWIGDQQYLHQRSSSNQIADDPINVLDTLSWMEILDRGSWTKQQDGSFIRDIKFTVFDSGYFEIPIFQISLNGETLNTNPIGITVNYLPDDTQQLLPIKDIQETKGPSPILMYAIIIFCFIIFMLIVLYYFFKADKLKPGKIIYQEVISPYEKAIAELNKLEQKKYWQQDQLKLYYDKLNEILRSYLAEGFKINALELTSKEIIQNIEDRNIQFKQLDLLKQNIKISDLVKFANLTPDIHTHSDLMKQAQEFVESNKSLSEELMAINKVHWNQLIGIELAKQFEDPNEIPPDILLQLKRDDSLETLNLISSMVVKNQFQLPATWVALHQSKLGQLSRWQYNLIMQNNQKWVNVLLMIVLIPLLTIFLPFLMIIALLKKESIFSRGIFVLSKHNKLMVNQNKLS